MKKCRNKSWESEWYWSKVWKVSLTTYESDPENTVFPPISLLDGCPVLKVSEILRLDRLFLILHVPSSVSISFVTSKKHKFWQSRSSVSSFDSFWFLTKWFLIRGGIYYKTEVKWRRYITCIDMHEKSIIKHSILYFEILDCFILDFSNSIECFIIDFSNHCYVLY